MTEASSFSVVPPAVDSNIFQSLKNTRKELRIPDDACVIITGAGSITDENKDIPKALEIASRIAVQRPVKMLVFGDGQLETPSNLDVHFCGPVSDRSLLAKYMNAADVLVSTSKMETYGMTMIEAMSCGTPVVAFGNGAISEVVEDGVTGLLSTSDNDSDLVKKLSILANDKALACRLGSQGQKLVKRRNEIGSFVDSYVRLYEAAGKTVSLTSPDLYHVSTN